MKHDLPRAMIEAWADLYGVALIDGETDAELKSRIIKRFIKPNLVINEGLKLPEDESIFTVDRWINTPKGIFMRHGEILDGKAKGRYAECSQNTLYISAELELVPLAYSPAPLKFADDNIEYRKVWLERGTIYGWILK